MSSYNPLVSPEYIAGTITISGGQIGVVQNLLALIIAQLEPNCRGAGLFVNLQADPANTTDVLIGCATKLGGALSTTNFGFALTAGDQSYRNTSGGGISAPIGCLQILSAAAASVHVEIFT